MGKGRIVLIAGVLGLYGAGTAAAAETESMGPAVELEELIDCQFETDETADLEEVIGFPEDGEAVSDEELVLIEPDAALAEPEPEPSAEDNLSTEAAPEGMILSDEQVSDSTGETAEEGVYPACQESAAEPADEDTAEDGTEHPMKEEDLPAAGTLAEESESGPIEHGSEDETAFTESEDVAAAVEEQETISDSAEEPEPDPEPDEDTAAGQPEGQVDQNADAHAEGDTVSTASAGGPIIETDIEIETISPAFPAKPSGTVDLDTDSSRTEQGVNGTVGNSGSGPNRGGQNGTAISPSRSNGTLGMPNSGRDTSRNGLDRLPKTGGPLGKTELLYVSLMLISAGVSLNWFSRRKRSVQ
ncbi:hypothetical protein NCCP2716_18000 [Sporosarcina sp. NCCP-2716]|uniref:hypothetical protein n=1 Tax=Sporosarcina sp. NCCP-2716 TaxID=2943679 RepID=UPI00203C8F5E|nr:hypothetical protein [Sporosarcina sp. NCCP-2716]GKV69302.1 hypothetical protein NCCP2716_18000 [Sporosarcina sp. NCCP-2716]